MIGTSRAQDTFGGINSKGWSGPTGQHGFEAAQMVPSSLQGPFSSSSSFPRCHSSTCGTSPVLVDSSHVSSRCSVRVISEIMSKFGPEKKALVTQIGFHGMLFFPALKQINRRFSAFLMSRVDEEAQTLSVSQGCSFQFSKEDVGKVFGIPCSGRSIFARSVKPNGGPGCPGSLVGGITLKQLRSVKAAQALVDREMDRPMTLAEQDEFKAAFVVFVMSTLLAPIAKHDCVADDYLHTLLDPSQIHSYDWSEYVIRRLLEAVSKLKADIATNVKSPYIYGCSLFLQVIYLDSIDLGSLSMPHDLLPRVRCFTSDRLRTMIAADSNFSAAGSSLLGVCCSKLRPKTGLCYSWSLHNSCDFESTVEASSVSLWEFSVSVTRVLKISPEAASPIFAAARDLQSQMTESVGYEALGFLSMLTHIVESYVKGAKNQSSPPASLQQNGLMPATPFQLGPTSVVNSISCSESTSQSKRKPDMAVDEHCRYLPTDTPLSKRLHHLDICSVGNSGVHVDTSAMVTHVPVKSLSPSRKPEVNGNESSARAISGMAGSFLSFRSEQSQRDIDLNNCPSCDVQPTSPVQTHAVLGSQHAPHYLTEYYAIGRAQATDILSKLRKVEDSDDNPWIVHLCPKYIEVLASSLKAQFLGESELGMDLFDALCRRFRQFDDVAYGKKGTRRWRHFVESDFMASLLAGSFHPSDPLVVAQFRGPHIRYDVMTCEMIFFPFLMQQRWVCFAWRLSDNTIVVFDPSLHVNSYADPLVAYQPVANILKSAMGSVSQLVSKRWISDWHEARLELFETELRSSSLCCSRNRTGVLCLMFCRFFDGRNLPAPLDLDNLDRHAAALISDVSRLLGNLGSVPCFYR